MTQRRARARHGRACARTGPRMCGARARHATPAGHATAPTTGARPPLEPVTIVCTGANGAQTHAGVRDTFVRFFRLCAAQLLGVVARGSCSRAHRPQIATAPAPGGRRQWGRPIGHQAHRGPSGLVADRARAPTGAATGRARGVRPAEWAAGGQVSRASGAHLAAPKESRRRAPGASCPPAPNLSGRVGAPWARIMPSGRADVWHASVAPDRRRK